MIRWDVERLVGNLEREGKLEEAANVRRFAQALPKEYERDVEVVAM